MNFSREGFYIGVDSGGTKCRLLISSAEKKKISLKNFEGVHYSITGAEFFSKTVAGYIKELIAGSGRSLKNCLGVCLGVAGAREEKDRKKLSKAIAAELNFKNVIVTTDAMTALYGAFEGRDGIILICGTGSVLYGYIDGKIVRIGGWGRVIGDEGSGYWIGKRALNIVSKEFDTGTFSKLSKELETAFGLNRANLNEKVFHKNFQIQNIAPIVIRCAESNCKVSMQIVDEAVSGLVEHIKAFIRVSGIDKNVNIAFTGSIIENNNILSNKLKREIRKLKIIKIASKKHSASYGAVLIASGKSSITKKI